MELKGSTFIVTGGAAGLGGATAQMVVEGGGNVVIVDLKDAEGEAHAKALVRRGQEMANTEFSYPRYEAKLVGFYDAVQASLPMSSTKLPRLTQPLPKAK